MLQAFRLLAALLVAVFVLHAGPAGAADVKPLKNASGQIKNVTTGDTLSIPALKVTGVTGATSQCLQASTAGAVTGTGAPCGAGGTGTLPALTIVQRTTTQLITTGVWTAVSWDTTAVQDDVAGFSSGAPTRITTPSGYTKIRLTCYGVWANATTGNRYLRIDKNGSTTLEMTSKTGVSEAGAHMMTRWYTVSAGDYFEMLVFHTVVGNLNFSPASGFAAPAYCQAEWN